MVYSRSSERLDTEHSACSPPDVATLKPVLTQYEDRRTNESPVQRSRSSTARGTNILSLEKTYG